MELKDAVLNALLHIQANGPEDVTIGICGNITNQLDKLGIRYDDDDIDGILYPAFQSWPDKSDSTAYPVGKWSNKPSKLFWDHFDTNRSMWLANTKYGKARIALLNWAIKELG